MCVCLCVIECVLALAGMCPFESENILYSFEITASFIKENLGKQNLNFKFCT